MHLIIVVIPNQIQAQENKNAIQHHTVSPKPLAQAEGSRSGETGSLRRAPPSPRRGLKENQGLGNTGSRLSEIPLAWASCLLAQKLSEPSGRLFAQ